MRNKLPDIKNIKAEINTIESGLGAKKNISLSIARLDKIHREISGNKFFKLYYYLQEALTTQKSIITFGGAYSNYLAATASACKLFGINCIGMVRGQSSEALSHTLLFCKEQGMKLKFISREKYKDKDKSEFKNELLKTHDAYILIPEGGFGEKGMKGAALISNLYNKEDFTHICCAAGTATTVAGLIKSSLSTQQIIGFSALKNLNDFDSRIQLLVKPICKNYCLINDYHFGGYAKKTDELIAFMNAFYTQYFIPTDFVYTAKMMFGIFDLIKKNYFHPGSKILCIHTGGLQGNFSLPHGILNF